MRTFNDTVKVVASVLGDVAHTVTYQGGGNDDALLLIGYDGQIITGYDGQTLTGANS